MARREPDDWTALWNEIAQVFSPGAPIDESELFAGRVEQLQDLINAVNQRGQHAIVFGERGVGKTSLANTFTLFVHRPTSKAIAKRINCDGVTSFQNLWKKVFEEIGVTSAVSRDMGPDDIRRSLAQLSGVSRPIIVLDEFDRIAPGKTPGLIADTIKSLSDHSVNTTIILVGVADSVAELLRGHASIGRALVEIPMPRMSDEEIEEILDKRATRLGMKMKAEVRKRIVGYSQGLPHYTHLIGLNAFQEAASNKTKDVSSVHLKKSIDKCIAKAQQAIKDAYHQATSSPRPDNLFKEVLLACSLATTDELGFFAASDVVAPMSNIMGHHYAIPSFARHLKEFCSEERGKILDRRGEKRKFRYRFRDALMRPYVTLQAVSAGLLPPGYL
jgi:Cdc6-like AAA superfamily ATPase